MVSYKESGVDIDAGNELVARLLKMGADVGGFGGLYPLGDNYLVAGADGVGTKLKLAHALGKHETVGIDLVAMCVNDVATTGAEPLFFLDYFSTSKLELELAEEVLKGIVAGCREAGCALLGGETAEMPGFYREGEYDLAGFAVGIVPKKDLIDGKIIVAGDCLVGIASSGLHSNGFSLVRRILELSGRQPTEEYLTPTRLYPPLLKRLKQRYSIRGIAHITGGGVTENIPRMLPEGLSARIDRKSWPVPEIFLQLQKLGNVEEEEMYRTFNMGIGLVLALSPEEAERFIAEEEGWIIGMVA